MIRYAPVRRFGCTRAIQKERRTPPPLRRQIVLCSEVRRSVQWNRDYCITLLSGVLGLENWLVQRFDVQLTNCGRKLSGTRFRVHIT
jgi:hypothetical protein